MKEDKSKQPAADAAQALVKAAGEETSVVVVMTDGSVSELHALSDEIRELGSEPEGVIPIEELIGDTINIIGAEIVEGDFGSYLFITYRDGEGRLWATTTGAVIIMRKLLAIRSAGRFPVSATIGKVNDYYTLD